MAIKRIYLAGPMENVSDDEAQEWRIVANDCLSPAGIICLDPTRRRHNFEQKYMKRIFELDMIDLRDCDMVLVNLNNDKLAKHGTAMEVFYASYVLRKPVVAFKNEFTRYHPFFESLVTEWRSDVRKACDTIVSQYL
jgi:nucleoside 2-deoxyribosyltransferase